MTVINFADRHQDTKEVLDALEGIAERIRSGEAVGFLSIVLSKTDETSVIASFTQPVSALKVRGMLHVGSEIFNQ